MKQNSLHFIHSLNKQEKRYFKLYASLVEGEEGNMYMYLFDLIESNNPDDEAFIKKQYTQKFEEKTYVSTKHYLRLKVLEALRVLQEHAYGDIEQKITQLLENAIIFYKKGFYKFCEKEIIRAEKLAQEAELWDKLYEIVEKKIAFFYDIFINNPKTDEHTLTGMIAQKDSALSQRITENNLLNIIHEISFMLKKWDNSQKKDRIADFLNNPILQTPPDSHVLQIKYYLAKSRIHKFLGNNEEYCENYRNIYELFKNQKVSTEIEARTLLMACTNYITALAAAQKIDEAQQVLEYLQKITPNLRKLIADVQFTVVPTLRAQKVVYLHTANYAALSKLEKQFENFLEPGNPYFPKTIIIELRYSLAYAHFKLQKYNQALSQINVVLNDKDLLANCSNLYVYVYSSLYLLCHYELGNFQFLQYEIDRQKDLVSKLEVTHEILPEVFKMLKKLCKYPDNRKKILLKYLPVFEAYETQNPNTPIFLGIAYWIKEQLNAME